MSNKGLNYWLDKWVESDIKFHQDDVDVELATFWPQLNLPANSHVLVPLCGKSLDLIWLLQQGYQVTGIELSQRAIEKFSSEHHIEFESQQASFGITYQAGALNIIQADIFALTTDCIAPVDAIYDRAALIALPEKLRGKYVAQCLGWLKAAGNVLLKTIEYDEREMSGPPYNVSKSEVALLYQRAQQIEILKAESSILDASNHLYARGLRSSEHITWQLKL